MATDLLSDEKETAEHRMLVDLGRNDIGRISETASVCYLQNIWKWSSSVMLCISSLSLTSVVMRLLPELTAMDALKSTPGMPSGAPARFGPARHL